MTDDEAKAMLASLSEHFKEPVMPVSRYCASLQLWQGALRDRAERTEDKVDKEFSAAVDRVFLNLQKSNLLWRLIYRGQPLRTEMCPLHQGQWSGCAWDPCPHGCSDGNNVTGWLLSS